MHSKLAGHLPLQEMIAATLESARSKIAAAEEKEEKKGFPFGKKKEEKKESPAHERGESKKEEKEEHEKMSSAVLNYSDPESMDKLAAALDEFGDELLKEADSIENGGESHQGGQQLATMSPVGGKQVYTGAKAKHQVPTSTGMQGDPSQGKAQTQVPNDHARAPGGTGAKYPAKGVLKTGAAALKAIVEKVAEEKNEDKAEEKAEKKPPFAKKEETKEKKSEAVDFILNKLAEYHGGGETLDSKSGDGPKPPSQPGRQLIANNQAPVSATKREAKGPGRKQLSEVLSEPAQTKSTDSTVQDNLRNAAKGGVKIAAVKAYLGKIAEAGCVCAGAGECDYCRMKAAVEKKRTDKKVKQSLGMPPGGPAPMAGGPVGGTPTGGM